MAAHVAHTRNLDAKGRLTLGQRFAHKTVVVRQAGEDEFVISLARVIPEREAWLYDNARARTSVRKGLSQARARRFSKKPPDLTRDAALANQLADR